MCEHARRLGSNEEKVLPSSARRLDRNVSGSAGKAVPAVEPVRRLRRPSVQSIAGEVMKEVLELPREVQSVSEQIRHSINGILADEAALPTGGQGKPERIRFRDLALRGMEAALGIDLPKGDPHKKYDAAALTQARNLITGRLSQYFSAMEIEGLLPKFLKEKKED